MVTERLQIQNTQNPIYSQNTAQQGYPGFSKPFSATLNGGEQFSKQQISSPQFVGLTVPSLKRAVQVIFSTSLIYLTTSYNQLTPCYIPKIIPVEVHLYQLTQGSEYINSNDSPLRNPNRKLKRHTFTNQQSIELVRMGSSDNNFNEVPQNAPIEEEKSQNAIINTNLLDNSQNTAHEKSLGRVSLSLTKLIIDSFWQALGNFAVLYYIALWVLNFRHWNSFTSAYIVMQGSLHVVVSVIDLMRNKVRIYKTFHAIDNQLLSVYDGSTKQFKQTRWTNLSPLNIIKLERGQPSPSDGIIIATMGMQDAVNLIDQTGGQLFKKAALTNVDLNNLQVEGYVQYDEKLVGLRSKLFIRLNSEEHQVDLSVQNKIKKNQVNMSMSEIFVLAAKELKKTQSTYEKVQIDPKFRFTINIQQLLIIFFNLIAGCVLSVAFKFHSNPIYLHTGIETSFFDLLVEYLVMLSWSIPIYQTVNIYLINRISSFKTESDRLLDPDLSEKTVQIFNSCALPRMAKARYLITDLNTLSRPIKQVQNIYINKMSDEVNLQNPFQIVSVSDVEDQTFVQREVQYALLAMNFDVKTEDDIAIQKAILNFGLIVGTNASKRVVQDQDLIQQFYTKLAEYKTHDFALYCFEEVQFNKQKRYFYVYRSDFQHCKSFIDETIYNQLKDQVEDVDTVQFIFKRNSSQINIMKIVNTLKQRKELGEETLAALRSELEPILFIDIQQSHNDSHMELMDLHNSDYKVWINTYLNNVQILEDDFTLNNLIKYCQTERISCPNAQELSEKLDQIKQICSIKGLNKSQKYYCNDKPLLVYLDEISFSVGMKNQIISEKFADFIYKVPFVILLNYRSSVLKLIDLQPDQIIGATKYTCLDSSISIKYNDIPCDVYVPHFGFVPKLLIHHSKLSLMKMRHSIVFGNYTSLLIGLIQIVYCCYNRFSSQYFLNEVTNFIVTLFSFFYGLAFISFLQDFPFHIFARFSNFELITRISFNPYIKLLKDFFLATFHACCIVLFTLNIFVGSNDANGYVHGVPFHQVMAFIFLIVTIAFKLVLELYRVAKLQLLLSIVYITVTYIAGTYIDSDFQAVFDTGLKTKELVSLIFIPICMLFPSLAKVYVDRVVRNNEINTAFYRMQKQQDDEVEMQRLKEAKNYIKRLDKDEDEEPENEELVDAETKKQFA